MNNSVCTSTGEAPSKLLFGVLQRGKINNELKEFIGSQQFQGQVDLLEIRELAAHNIVIRVRSIMRTFSIRNIKIPENMM